MLEPSTRWSRLPILGWIGLLLVMLATLAGPAIERTQEARVLVTAREMLSRPMGQWNIPITNGAVRLRKPPLAYWASALSMKIFGAKDWAGRLPFALCAWATVGVLAMIGQRLFNPRTGMLAGLMLSGTLLFSKFGRLAETDTMAMFFVTLGVWAMLESIARPSMGAKIAWWILLGLGGAGAALAKGPPAAYLLLIGVALAMVRDRKLGLGLLIFIVITLLPIGLWYLSVRHHPEFGQLEDDFANSAHGGKGHSDGPWVYLWMIPQFMLPWAGLFVLSLVGAGVRAIQQKEYSIEVIVWTLAIFIPLCAWGNKQFQYLTILYPPLLMITAWWLDLWLSGRLTGGWAIWTRVVTMVTTLGMSVLVPRGRVMMILLYGMFVIVAMGIWFGYVSPHRQKGNARRAALAIHRQVGDAPLVFRDVEALPLCFYLGQVVPVLPEKDFLKQLRLQPGEIGIERDRPSNFRPLPEGLIEVLQVRDDDQTIRLIRASDLPR